MKIVGQKSGRVTFVLLCGLLVSTAIALTIWPARSFAAGQSQTVSGHQADDAEFFLIAVEKGRADVVRLLVHNGADVNVCVRGDGTPLMVAAQRGNLAMIKTLSSLGANVNVPCRGDGNPLIVASRYGHLDIVKWLLAHGATVDASVPEEETALITAVRHDRFRVVKYLVTHGANVNLGVMTPSGQWRTPLNQADDSSIREFLLRHGAKNPPPTPPSRRWQGGGRI